jgi:hypothetical protein
MDRSLQSGENDRQIAAENSTPPAMLQRLHQRLLQPAGIVNTQQIHCHADRPQTLTERLMRRSELPDRIQSRYEMETARSSEWISRFSGQRIERSSSGGGNYEMVQRLPLGEVTEASEFAPSIGSPANVPPIQTWGLRVETVSEQAIIPTGKVVAVPLSTIQTKTQKEVSNSEIPTSAPESTPSSVAASSPSGLFRVSRRGGQPFSAIEDASGTEWTTGTSSTETPLTPASATPSPPTVQAQADTASEPSNPVQTPQISLPNVTPVQLRELPEGKILRRSLSAPESRLEQPPGGNSEAVFQSLPLQTSTSPIAVRAKADVSSQAGISQAGISQTGISQTGISQIGDGLPTVKPIYLKASPGVSPETSELPILRESPMPPVIGDAKVDRTAAESLPSVKISSLAASISPSIVQAKSLPLAAKSGNRDGGVGETDRISYPPANPAIVQRQEVTPISSEPSTPAISPAAPPPPASGSSEVDIAEIAEQVSRILGRQMIVERERRGLNS